MSDHPLASRRTVLGGLALLGAAAMLPGSPAAATASTTGSPTGFMAASSRLTGIALSGSYLQLADQLWAELIKLDGSESLDRVVALAASADSDEALQRRLIDDGLMPSAQRIIRAWYTGMIDIPDSGRPGLTATKVVTYNDAVVWAACSFTKPPATCGGPFGYWNLAPQG
jgi:hypothetical protein